MKRYPLSFIFLFNTVIYAGFDNDLEPQETVPWVKQVWPAAYQGNFALAKTNLQSAATKNNLVASMFLAQAYKDGSLVTGRDEKQANSFEELTSRLKEQRKNYFIEKEKQNNFPRIDPNESGNLYFTLHIQRIERKNNKREKRIEAIQYARGNKWYANVIDILKQKHDSAYDCLGHEFKVPPIATGMSKLVDLYTSDNGEDVHFSLLKTGIAACPSDEVYETILKKITKEYEPPVHKKKELLPLAHTWAIAKGKEQDLALAYSHFFGHICVEGSDTLSKEADAMLTLIPLYHEVDKNRSIWWLDYFNKKKIKQLSQEGDLDNPIIIRFLTCLWQLSPDTLKMRAQKILNKTRLKDFLALALRAKPHAMQPLAQSPLATECLIEKAFERALVETNNRCEKSFLTFLKFGGAYHEKYQDRMVRTLPQFLKEEPSADTEVLGLINSPVKQVRIAAFNALVESFSRRVGDDTWFTHYALPNLFKKDLRGLVGKGAVTDAYHAIFKACVNQNNVQAIQVLWKHMSTSEQKEEKELLSQMVKDWFCLPSGFKIPTESFYAELNSALKTVVQSAAFTDPARHEKISEFLMAANKTKFTYLIDPVFAQQYKMQAVLDGSASVGQRCQFLSDILMMRIKGEESYNDIAECFTQLPDSEFKTYAQTVIAMLNAQNYYDYFSKRRLLKEFMVQNPSFIAEPDVIRWRMLQPYNPFAYDKKKGTVQAVSPKLKDAKIDNNLVIGFISHETDCEEHGNNVCRLYAYNAQDGDPIWAAPFVSTKKEPLYAQGCREIFCVMDDNRIAVLNKADGSVVAAIKPLVNEPIKTMEWVSGTLFVAHDTQLAIVDLVNKNFTVLPLPEKIAKPRKSRPGEFIVGEKIVFKQGSSAGWDRCVLIDNQGDQQTITFEKPQRFEPYICGNSTTLFYQQCLQDNKEYIVSVALDTGHQEGRYEVPSSLQGCPRLSKKGDKLFILADEKLIALDANNMQELWSVSVRDHDSSGFFQQIKRVLVSDDDTTVYVTQASNNDGRRYLLKFDANTGHIQQREQAEGQFLGVYEGVVYVQ